MATPNHRFTQARHRTASPTRPDECVSHQELAELVNDYLWRHHQQRVELDTDYIGKIERGVIQCPNRRYAKPSATSSACPPTPPSASPAAPS